MRVESQAGKFVLSFEEIRPGEGELVITGKMGVWEATAFMTLSEILGILRLTLRPRLLGFLVKSIFTGGFRSRPRGDA